MVRACGCKAQAKTKEFSATGTDFTRTLACLTELVEKELVREGEKLSDLLSMPVKDALGRELSVSYAGDIVNVREVLDMSTARRQLFRDSVELQCLTLQQATHVHDYEKDAAQVKAFNFSANVKNYFALNSPIRLTFSLCLFLCSSKPNWQTGRDNSFLKLDFYQKDPLNMFAIVKISITRNGWMHF